MDTKLTVKNNTQKCPIVWQRFSNGLVIKDLQEEYFDQILDLIKNYYLPFDELLKNMEIDDLDEFSKNEFADRIHFHLKNESSLIIMDEINNEICGFLILRAIPKIDYARALSRTEIFENDFLKNRAIITTSLFRKIDVYEQFDCEIFLKIYYICILPNFRQKGLGTNLILSAIDVARSRNIPVLIATITDHKIMNLVTKLNMEIIYEIDYIDYEDEYGRYLIKELKEKNCKMYLMAVTVPSYPLRPAPKILKEEDKTNKGKGKDKKNKKK